METSKIIKDSESEVAVATTAIKSKRGTDDSDAVNRDGKRRKGLNGDRIISTDDSESNYTEVISIRRSVKRPLNKDDGDNSDSLSSSPATKKIRNTAAQDELKPNSMMNFVFLEELIYEFLTSSPNEPIPILTGDDLALLALSTPLPDDDDDFADIMDYLNDDLTPDPKMNVAILEELSNEFCTSSPIEPMLIRADDDLALLALSQAPLPNDDDDAADIEDNLIESPLSPIIEVEPNASTQKNNDHVYLVNKITSRRLIPGRRQKQPAAADFEYSVSWRGYNEGADTWEPYENIKHLLNTSKDDVTKNNIYEVDEIKSCRLKKKLTIEKGSH